VIQILNFRCGYFNERIKNMMIRRITGVALLFCLSGVALAIAVAEPQTSNRQTTARDPKIIDAQGYQQLVEQYRGKPLLVTFWATWCEPCRDEYPMLNELAKQYAPQGLHVVGVDLDDDGDLILMRRFIARYQPVFPNFRKKKGGESDFVNAVLPGWNGAIPASVFYAKDGRQIGHLVGENNRDTYQAAIRMVLSSGDGTSATSR
jgi:thiol-disulfide isomerase/thioredoxin